MKKTVATFCVACIAGSASLAQPSEKIGNMEITYKKNDTLMLVVTELSTQPSQNESKPTPKNESYKLREISCFIGFGFAFPDNGRSYYTTLGINSYNIDVGWHRRYNLSREFALGWKFQYSFYHYRLRDATDDPVFMETIIGRSLPPNEIRKQAYRSNNIAVSAFTRYYLVPGNLYVDLGIQGDMAFSRYYKLYYPNAGQQKFRDNYAFNPFMASAVVQMGWDNFAVFARYRLTDAFNRSALSKDIPQLSIGIRLGD
jgi:hypothetical protein